MKDLILLGLGAILANNLVLTSFLGVESIEDDLQKSAKAIALTGVGLTGTMLVASLLNWVLETTLLVSAPYLQTLVYTVVVLLVVYLAEFFSHLVKKEHPSTLPVALNAIVLGGCLIFAQKGLTLPETIFSAIGAGIGYMVVSFAVTGVRERINDKYVPAAFRGIPVTVAAMGIIALAVLAF